MSRGKPRVGGIAYWRNKADEALRSNSTFDQQVQFLLRDVESLKQENQMLHATMRGMMDNKTHLTNRIRDLDRQLADEAAMRADYRRLNPAPVQGFHGIPECPKQEPHS